MQTSIPYVRNIFVSRIISQTICSSFAQSSGSSVDAIQVSREPLPAGGSLIFILSLWPKSIDHGHSKESEKTNGEQEFSETIAPSPSTLCFKFNNLSLGVLSLANNS